MNISNLFIPEVASKLVSLVESNSVLSSVSPQNQSYVSSKSSLFN